MRNAMKSLLVASALTTLVTSAQAETCRKLSNGARLSATGDILVHKALYEGIIGSSQKFKTLWSKLIPVLRDADFTVGNLEGPVAPGVNSSGKSVRDVGWVYDGEVYSGTNFRFNYHPQLLKDLQASGFDMVTTANNHSLDRGWLGVDRTIDQLNTAGMPFVGTRKSDSSETRQNIVRVGSFRFGVISCTEMINGNPDPKNQVLTCGNKSIVDSIASLKQKTDGVIVFPHWGEEYELRPNSYEKSKAREWIAAGAMAIIGNHPHVLQTTEWIARPDGGQALVVYSLGNFVAAQRSLEKRASAIVHLDFAMGAGGAQVAQFSYTPIVRPEGSLWTVPVQDSSSEAKYIRSQLGQSRCL